MSLSSNHIAESVFNCSKCNHSSSFDKIYYQQRLTPHIAFILQNPGPPTELDKARHESIKNESPLAQASFHSKELIGWLKSTKLGNMEYFYKIFSLFYRYELINTPINNVGDYLYYVDSQNVFNDIYFTDAVKCVGKTSDMDKLGRTLFSNCISNYLTDELMLLSNLKVVFVFSTRAWNGFKSVYKINCVQNLDLENTTIAQAHGYVFEAVISSELEKIKVIPLTHMSPTSRNNLLRNSYYDYLEEGIKYLKNN